MKHICPETDGCLTNQNILHNVWKLDYSLQHNQWTIFRARLILSALHTLFL